MRKINKKGIGRSNFESEKDSKIILDKRKVYNKILDLNASNLATSLLINDRRSISRILYYNQIYNLIINKPGVICEFGVEFGATLTLLSKLRAIYEPYNYSRKIYGFDTFEGFTKNLTTKEKKQKWKKGDYTVPKGYENFLDKLMHLEEENSPLNHIKKYDLIKGDASKTIKSFLNKNPHLLISLAIFDMDVFKPTNDCIKAILPRLFKGSVLVFDELNHPEFPGEVEALLKILI